MGEKELYDYYNLNFKVHAIDWTQEKAKKILEAWQRKFTKVCAKSQNLNKYANPTLAKFSKYLKIFTLLISLKYIY